MASSSLSAQKKRALSDIESQFSASASQPIKNQNASKKSKKNESIKSSASSSSSPSVSNKSPEEEPFYSPLSMSSKAVSSLAASSPSSSVPIWSHANGRSRLQQQMEELLPTSALYSQKIYNQHIMLENPVKTPSAESLSEQQLARRAAADRKQMMSARERKRRHWTRLDAKGLSYEALAPLHELWMQYIEDAFSEELTRGKAPDENRLLKADLHGAILTVIRSKCPTRVGVSGIVAQETYHSFRLIDTQNRLHTLPKEHSVFSLSLGAHRVRLFGDQLVMRAAERTVKKFKHRFTIEL